MPECDGRTDGWILAARCKNWPTPQVVQCKKRSDSGGSPLTPDYRVSAPGPCWGSALDPRYRFVFHAHHVRGPKVAKFWI